MSNNAIVSVVIYGNIGHTNSKKMQQSCNQHAQMLYKKIEKNVLMKM